MVKSAAIKFGGKIYTGKNHADIMSEIRKTYPDAHFPHPDDQGFINDKNQYMRRAPALLEAILSGQVEKGKTINSHELFSEDLYNDKEETL